MFEVKVVGILFNAFGLWEDLKLLWSTEAQNQALRSGLNWDEPEI